MQVSDLLGYAAATLSNIAFVPQVWRTWRTRDVSGISLRMYSVFTASVAVWLAYGIVLGEVPMMISNSVGLVLASAVLVMKVRYGRQARLRDPAAAWHDDRAKQSPRHVQTQPR
jgi:MtN3 and saliva related transmembrane protein